MKYVTTVVLSLSFFFSSAACQEPAKKDGELTDGLEILKKADAAVKALKAVQYKASFKGLGPDEARLAKVEGTVVMSGWSNSAPQKFRYVVKVQRSGSTEIVEYTAGSDGDMVYFVDPSKKMAYEDIDPAVMGSNARTIGTVALRKLLNPEGFADELDKTKTEKIELKGVTKVGDQECYEVNVLYGKDGGEGTWFFSKNDFLPRRLDRLFLTRSGEKGGRQTILTDLVANPKLDNDAFKLTLPEGFTKTDDFAP